MIGEILRLFAVGGRFEELSLQVIVFKVELQEGTLRVEHGG
jgi:hypothetical protein